MNNDTVGTPWRRFRRTITGMWREPLDEDFAMIAAASLAQEKAALLPPLENAARLAVWEDEGGLTAQPIPSPSPRRRSEARRRPSYSP